jgi:ribosomal protein L4
VLETEETGALRSFRNIERVAVAEASAVGVADLIGAASIVVSQKALEVLQSRAGEPSKVKSAAEKSTTQDSGEKAGDAKDGE